MSAEPSSTTAPRAILIVDDDSQVREMLRELLSPKGYEVRIVADAASALREVAAASPPEIVLLDINMPGLGGLNVLPAIHQLAPRTIVMLMSGEVDADRIKQARTYGAFDFFTKPIDIADLVQSIDVALGFRAVDR